MAGHNEPGSRLAGASARQTPSPAPSPIGSGTQWAQVPQVTGVAGLSVASGSRSGFESGSAVCSGSMLRASGYQVRTSSRVAGGVNECAATEPSRWRTSQHWRAGSGAGSAGLGKRCLASFPIGRWGSRKSGRRGPVSYQRFPRAICIQGRIAEKPMNVEYLFGLPTPGAVNWR